MKRSSFETKKNRGKKTTRRFFVLYVIKKLKLQREKQKRRN
jgi:hypothetical protein